MVETMKKVTSDELETIMNNMEHEVSVDWHGTELIVKRCIDLDEMIVFVNSVAESCFEDGGKEYRPEAKDLAVRNKIVELYSNVDLPHDLRAKYDILFGTDLVDTILAHIDMEQFNSIDNAIYEKINYLTDLNIQMLGGKVKESIDIIMNLAKGFGDMFGGIEGDDIQKLLQAVMKGGLDEEKLMAAYMERRAPNAEAEAKNE